MYPSNTLIPTVVDQIQKLFVHDHLEFDHTHIKAMAIIYEHTPHVPNGEGSMMPAPPQLGHLLLQGILPDIRETGHINPNLHLDADSVVILRRLGQGEKLSSHHLNHELALMLATEINLAEMESCSALAMRMENAGLGAVWCGILAN